ncbi:unnamed protein product, partial [Pylaiella littoralis]
FTKIAVRQRRSGRTSVCHTSFSFRLWTGEAGLPIFYKRRSWASLRPLGVEGAGGAAGIG